jgi:hypothetical protein
MRLTFMSADCYGEGWNRITPNPPSGGAGEPKIGVNVPASGGNQADSFLPNPSANLAGE